MKWIWNELKDEFVTYMKAGTRGGKVNDSWAGSVCKLWDMYTHIHLTLNIKNTHTHRHRHCQASKLATI